MVISPKELKEKLERQEPLVLIDVREPWENSLARIEGSVLIPLGELPNRVNELDRDTLTVLYCHHGVRSLEAAYFLRLAGLQDPRSLTTGIDGWSQTVDPSIPRY